MALIFPVASTNGDTVCINITTLDNNAFEKTEHFFLDIVCESNIQMDISRTQVNITDDDSEYNSFEALLERSL